MLFHFWEWSEKCWLDKGLDVYPLFLSSAGKSFGCLLDGEHGSARLAVELGSWGCFPILMIL